MPSNCILLLCDKLVTKVNTSSNSGFVLENQYRTEISYLEKKIDDADKNIRDNSGLAKKTTDYYAEKKQTFRQNVLLLLILLKLGVKYLMQR